MKKTSATVGSYEAKTHFSELLERVESGEEITITRHGNPIAHLVPFHGKSTREERRVAIDAIQELAKGNKLRGLKVKDLRGEGRR